MDYIVKLTAVCLITVVISQLFKKNQPEMTLILGTCIAIYSMFCIMDFYRDLVVRFEKWEKMISLTDDYFFPLLKCFGISVISQFGVNACKDAGQGAVASCLEICGNIAVVWCIVPLFEHVFTIIEELL